MDRISPFTMGRDLYVLGDTFAVLVIGTIDCSNCGGNGWFELHLCSGMP